jgi:hypothetical protein
VYHFVKTQCQLSEPEVASVVRRDKLRLGKSDDAEGLRVHTCRTGDDFARGNHAGLGTGN